MARFAVMPDGKVWVEISSLADDIVTEAFDLVTEDEPDTSRIMTMLDVVEELLDKRDETLRVTRDTNSEVDSAQQS